MIKYAFSILNKSCPLTAGICEKYLLEITEKSIRMSISDMLFHSRLPTPTLLILANTHLDYSKLSITLTPKIAYMPQLYQLFFSFINVPTAYNAVFIGQFLYFSNK